MKLLLIIIVILVIVLLLKVLNNECDDDVQSKEQYLEENLEENFEENLEENFEENLEENFESDQEGFRNMRGSRPNKCFDCEVGLSDDKLHIGYPSKCFDCEKQSNNAFYEGPNKCFDCEHRTPKINNCIPANFKVAGNMNHFSPEQIVGNNMCTMNAAQISDSNCTMCERNKLINRV